MVNYYNVYSSTNQGIWVGLCM